MPVRLDGEKVHGKMVERGFTNVDMVRETGLSLSTIDRIVNNRASKYSDHTVNVVAKALGCEAFEIYTDEALKEAISQAASKEVENIVVEAIAQAVTVVADEIAPEAAPVEVAEAIPSMTVNMPPAFDIPLFIQSLRDEHDAAIANLASSHEKHMSDLRRERNVWRTLSIGLMVLLCISCIVSSFPG